MTKKFAGLVEKFQGRSAEIIRQEEGATAVEYALLVGLIAVVLIVGVGLFGTQLNSFFNALATWVTGIMP